MHIGHVAALLPGDVLARYHRQVGDEVCYVSGTDCHGTPVTICAKNNNKTPQEVSDSYHAEFSEVFAALGFSYDVYGKTSSQEHKSFVKDFHRTMYERKNPPSIIAEKETKEAYCASCKQFLPDRFVTGRCPSCGETARGDQCEACGNVLESEQLIDATCAICKSPAEFKPTKHLFIKMTELQGELAEYLDRHTDWRKNAYEMTKRYINEGLRDRAITRDLDWGIDVPCEGYENKRIYVWAENVLGYLSMSYQYVGFNEEKFRELWGEGVKHYYVMGKDNIPFHSVILPSLLLAHGEGLRLPDVIVSSEYMILEGRKISTSKNHAIWAKDIIGEYNPDSIRYYLLANGPEKRDADFTRREFINSNNGELLGAYGNLVNRTLVFVKKYFDNKIPVGKPDEVIEADIVGLYKKTAELIQACEFKSTIETVFLFIRSINKYFDTKAPWVNPEASADTIYNCCNAIQNIAVLLYPFLPFSSEKVLAWLKADKERAYKPAAAGTEIGTTEILFARY